jgi:hypothetical protein
MKQALGYKKPITKTRKGDLAIKVKMRHLHVTIVDLEKQ